ALLERLPATNPGPALRRALAERYAAHQGPFTLEEAAAHLGQGAWLAELLADLEGRARWCGALSGKGSRARSGARPSSSGGSTGRAWPRPAGPWNPCPSSRFRPWPSGGKGWGPARKGLEGQPPLLRPRPRPWRRISRPPWSPSKGGFSPH